MEPDLGTPLDAEWLSSNGDLIEDGSSLENPPTTDGNGGLDFNEQTSDNTDIAANQCVTSSSPLRKLRNRGKACDDFFNPGPEIKLPDLEDIGQETSRKTYCGKSRWATFGNIPICLVAREDINIMTTAALFTDALPLSGWAYVYGYVRKCLSWLKSLHNPRCRWVNNQ